jgi:hypothetical protein
MSESLRDMLFMLSIAMLVATAARRVKLPYAIGLAGVGALLAFSKVDIGPDLTSELILDLILPPLLFEAAQALRWRELCADLAPTLTFAALGTVIAMFKDNRLHGRGRSNADRQNPAESGSPCARSARSLGDRVETWLAAL